MSMRKHTIWRDIVFFMPVILMLRRDGGVTKIQTGLLR